MLRTTSHFSFRPTDSISERSTPGAPSGPREIVTTDAVLVEIFAHMSSLGRQARERAAQLLDDLVADPHATIVHQDAELFFAGVDLYRRRLDKGYSLTDCMSMIVCRKRAITDVLSHDRHFVQEGFTLLL